MPWLASAMLRAWGYQGLWYDAGSDKDDRFRMTEVHTHAERDPRESCNCGEQAVDWRQATVSKQVVLAWLMRRPAILASISFCFSATLLSAASYFGNRGLLYLQTPTAEHRYDEAIPGPVEARRVAGEKGKGGEGFVRPMTDMTPDLGSSKQPRCPFNMQCVKRTLHSAIIMWFGGATKRAGQDTQSNKRNMRQACTSWLPQYTIPALFYVLLSTPCK